MNQKYGWELKYPPHPKIIKERKDVVKYLCSFNPYIIKNEVEYIGSVIDDSVSKIFTLENGAKLELSIEKGKINIKCIDIFEDIFLIDREILKNNELLDILNP